MKISKQIKRFRVESGHHFKLSDFDPGDTGGLDIGKSAAKDILSQGLVDLDTLQAKLYAEHRWAVLIVLQGIDAAGKDGVIKHVMSGVNPQGCAVHAFKEPTPEELDHDFLWRSVLCLPRRGHIGIFNRSYYEDVLVVRVRPELLKTQHLPPHLVTKDIWKERFKSIRALERHLGLNGTVVLKFHLRLSKEEQRRRLLARLDEPAKRWKFSMDDAEAHKAYDKYMAAYEDAIAETATPEAPWYVVPADHKWFAWLTVSAVITNALDSLDLQIPKIEGNALADLKKVRHVIEAEK
jgi:PPK2 family polyphosphate:nucleotide phosphotransferase